MRPSASGVSNLGSLANSSGEKGCAQRLSHGWSPVGIQRVIHNANQIGSGSRHQMLQPGFCLSHILGVAHSKTADSNHIVPLMLVRFPYSPWKSAVVVQVRQRIRAS